MKQFQIFLPFIVLIVLGGCSSTADKADSDELDTLTIPDAETQGLSELDRLDGNKLTEVIPYDDNYGVPGPSAEPGEPLSVRIFYFDFDSSQVKPKDYSAINAHADYLIAHPDSRISLEGHTDHLGSREYNIALGEQRAKSVAKMMRLRGVADHQIQAVSYGEEKPVAFGNAEYALSQNRRVQIIYLR
ncbi:MAG: peptidoglycan-associated lipoprotein Pal [Gammaproteobacteria bacterium]|nr:peptidoglycan-associated lipoprotein Pal [Gammaproteobacteria bacterium]